MLSTSTKRILAAGLAGLVSLALVLVLVSGCRQSKETSSARQGPATDDCGWASRLQDWRGAGTSLFIADANLLTPYRMRLDGVSPHREPDLEFTPEKARQGGLGLAVLEILVTSAQLSEDAPFEALLEEIDQVQNELVMDGATRVLRTVSQTTPSNPPVPPVGVMLGVENLAPVDTDLDRLLALHERGIRLATPIHSRPNPFGDSSYSQDRPHTGLSPLGEELILRMNRLGIIVDVSHMSDDALIDSAKISRAPLVASHSGARHFTPQWERNLSDEGIRAVAATGGVVHIPFSGSFLAQAVKDREQPVWDHVEGRGLSINSLEGRSLARKFRADEAVDYATIDDVIRQIDYVVDLVGIDHVGFGSSFDGSGLSMAAGLEDASGYPRLIQGLCVAGYSPEAVEKISGGNFLRVWSDVERVSQRGAENLDSP